MNFFFKSISSKKLILDIGANQGHDGLRLTIENPNAHVLEFEAVPEMIQTIHKNYSNLRNASRTVRRLDFILKDLPFDLITYLHCDTQSSDLSVLRGLGELRKHLVNGIIECASSKGVAIYREQHLLEDVCFEFVR